YLPISPTSSSSRIFPLPPISTLFPYTTLFRSENIITFDAHDPRVQNAIPLSGFETVSPTYQFIKGLLRTVKDLKIDSEHMMAIRSEEHTSELQSRFDLVCRLLLAKKNTQQLKN